MAGAVAAATRLGVWMVNVHASGGLAMMRAAQDGRRRDERANRRHRAARHRRHRADEPRRSRHWRAWGLPSGVEQHVDRLAALASEAGLDGVVASPQEVAPIRRWADSRFLIVTPGIRAGDGTSDDQARTSGAADALRAGASYLVVGRPIIKAPDPRRAAERMLEEMTRSSE